MRFQVNNYKVGFRYCERLLPKLRDLSCKNKEDRVDIKFYNAEAFAVVRIDSFVYTINYSGYVNITGATNRERVATAIDIFSRKIAPLTLPIAYDVHNISASGHFGHRLSLLAVAKTASQTKLKSGSPCEIKLKLDRFPAMWLQFRAKSPIGEKLGTAGLFASGAFTLVGLKEESAIPIILDDIRDLALRAHPQDR